MLASARLRSTFGRRARGDLYWPNVKMLVQPEINALTNFSMNSVTLTSSGTISFSDDTPIPATKSIDLNNGYFRTGSSKDLAFSTHDFTVELFFLIDNNLNTPFLFDWRPLYTSIVSPALTVGYGGANKLNYYNGTGVVIVGTDNVTAGWHHAAVSRRSGVTRLFLDGILQGTYADSLNYAQTSPIFGALGYDPTLTDYKLKGKISGIRVTKGIGRYVDNFNVPTKKYLMEQQIAEKNPIVSATGGTVTDINGYRVHTFTTSGTFTVTTQNDYEYIEYLVIAGGGGGGSQGGGGAGGYRCNVAGELTGGGGTESPHPILSGSYIITVGAGGAAQSSSIGTAGGNSGITPNAPLGVPAIVSTGGGGGGSYNARDGGPGGSGGGAATGSGGGGAGGVRTADPVQGNDGALRQPQVNNSGSGGGGAGSAGVAGITHVGGNGGEGLTSQITGIPVTRGGGGGGATFVNSYPTYNSESEEGVGGSGGGGTGFARKLGLNFAPTPGEANTGGGGAGGGVADAQTQTYNTPTPGGSGIVIIRYPLPSAVTQTPKPVTFSAVPTGSHKSSGGLLSWRQAINAQDDYVIAAVATLGGEGSPIGTMLMGGEEMTLLRIAYRLYVYGFKLNGHTGIKTFSLQFPSGVQGSATSFALSGVSDVETVHGFGSNDSGIRSVTAQSAQGNPVVWLSGQAYGSSSPTVGSPFTNRYWTVSNNVSLGIFTSIADGNNQTLSFTTGQWGSGLAVSFSSSSNTE